MARILIALLVLSGSVGCGSSAELTLTRNGQTDYEIRIHSQADATENYAARELGMHLQKISGAEFKVRRENTAARNWIVIARPDSRLPKSATTNEPLGEEEFHIRADQDGIVIRGGAGRGLLYGVYEFLEGLGCRWFTSNISSIPRRATITVRHQNVRKKPAFELRQINSIDVRDSTWLVRNRINGGTHGITREQGGSREYAGRSSHTLYNLLPPAEHFQDHPEYFSLWHGKRTSTMAQICMTHPDVQRIVAQNIGRLMRENPDASYVSVSQMDWGGGCQCERCMAVDSEESQGLDHRVWSGGFVRFANAIAEKTAAQFPDKLIVTLAYGWTEAPPRKARPGKNVRILFCPIEACQVHDPQKCSDQATGKSLAHLRKWSELAAGRLYVWDYGIRFGHYLAPFPNLEALGDKWRHYQQLGVRGVYCQTGDTRSKGAESAWLRSYVQAKLLWDPSRDVKPIIEEFVRAVYGPAAEPVLAYYEELHRLVRHPDHHMGTTGSGGSYGFIDKPWLDRCRAHLRDAEEKAHGRADFLEAIERLGLGVRYLRFWSENTFVVPKERGAGILNPDASREALERVAKFLDDLGKLRIERLGESRRAEELSRELSSRMSLLDKISH